MMKLLSSLLVLMTMAVLLPAEAIVTSKPVLTGLSAAVGTTFNKLDGAIYMTEWGANRIRSFNPTTNQTVIVYSGICDGVSNANPQDIAISPNELSLGKSVFYVTCRNGDLFRLAWRIKTILPVTYGWGKTRVNPVAQSLGMVHQLQLDGLGHVYTVDYVGGRLLKINLADGLFTVITTGLQTPIGLLLTSDHLKAYVSQDTLYGIIVVNLLNGAKTQLSYSTPDGAAFVNMFYMLWDVQDQAFYITSRKTNVLARYSLATTPAKVTYVFQGLPSLPSSVCRTFSPFSLYVASDSVLTQISWFILFPPLSFAQPTIYRLGHIPSTSVNQTNGLATTDPGYFFHVKNAPFGGSVQMFFNFAKMRSLGAVYYKVFIDGSSTPTYASWNNYKWNAATLTFDLRAVAPDAQGRYVLPNILDLWAYPDLGFVLDTTMLSSNSLHTVSVSLYNGAGTKITVPLLKQSMEQIKIFVDNIPPQVHINAIQQFPGTSLSACGLVTSGSSRLIFNITAWDSLGFLSSWYFSDQYGHGSSASIAGDTYEPVHNSSSTLWNGVKSYTVEFDLCSSSIQCAHEFFLQAWSRATDGYNTLFYRSDFETLAVYLPGSACIA